MNVTMNVLVAIGVVIAGSMCMVLVVRHRAMLRRILKAIADWAMVSVVFAGLAITYLGIEGYRTGARVRIETPYKE